MRASSRRLALSLLLLAAACGRDVVFVEPRATTEPGDTTNGSDNGGGPTVQRGTLHVTVSVAPEDQAIAESIGMPAGVLAGTEVTARRLGQPLQRGTTDADGAVTFPDLVTGPWTVSVVRPLRTRA